MQDCGVDSANPTYCQGDDVFEDVTERGCSGSTCFANQSPQLVESCNWGCSGGFCILPCGSSSDCSWDERCSAGDCLPVFGSDFRFTFYSGTVAPTKANGDPWDGGLPMFVPPDPWINIDHGSNTACTTIASNTFAPVWNDSCDVQAVSGLPLVIEYLDEDVLFNDVIGTVSLATDTDIAGYVRTVGPWTIMGVNGTSLYVEVAPTP